MPTPKRSNGKAGFSQNNSGGVTILQWFKRFDAALGFRLLLAPNDYSEELPRAQAIAQIEAESDRAVNSLGWRRSLACRLRLCRLGLVAAWRLT
jgi:hypothetical protein